MYKLKQDGDGYCLSGDDARKSSTSLGFPDTSDTRKLRLSVDAASHGISSEFIRSNGKKCRIFPSESVAGAIVVEGIDGSWVRIAEKDVRDFISELGSHIRLSSDKEMHELKLSLLEHDLRSAYLPDSTSRWLKKYGS
jgi:hypothetical protein